MILYEHFCGHGERTTFRQLHNDGDLVLMPIEHIVTVYTSMYNVLAGKQDLAEFVRIVVLSIETEMTRDAYTALTTGMAFGTYPSQLSIQGAMNTETLLTLCETVQAYNFGVKPIIVGPATAIAKIIPDSAYGYRGNYDANGGSVNLLQNYYGFTLQTLPQVATPNYSNFSLQLDPDTVFVISPALDKLVKGVASNTLTNSNQFYENADITQNFTMRKDWIFEFASAGFGGMYKITD